MRRLLLVVVLAALTLSIGVAASAGRAGAEPPRHCEDHPRPGDADCDGTPDDSDNCPEHPNFDQQNTDAGYTPTEPPAHGDPSIAMEPGDGLGDACDADDDADKVLDSGDNCRLMRNPRQEDSNRDGVGDPCSVDSDGDGVQDGRDNCPTAPNADQADLNSDGRGDVCDADDDADGVPDSSDNCPRNDNPEQTDHDGDGLGFACDPGDLASPPPPPPPTVADTTAARLTVRIARRLTPADLRGGMPAAVACSEACALTARVTVSRRVARRMGVRSTILARGEAFLAAAGRTYVLFRPARGVLRSVRRGGPAVLRVRALDAGGNKSSEIRRIRFA